MFWKPPPERKATSSTPQFTLPNCPAAAARGGGTGLSPQTRPHPAWAGAGREHSGSAQAAADRPALWMGKRGPAPGITSRQGSRPGEGLGHLKGPRSWASARLPQLRALPLGPREAPAAQPAAKGQGARPGAEGDRCCRRGTGAAGVRLRPTWLEFQLPRRVARTRPSATDRASAAAHPEEKIT